MKNFLVLFVLATHVACAQTKTQIHLIPQPVTLQMGNGQFTITKKTVIAAADEADQKSAQYLNDYLQHVYGFKLDVDRQESKDYIRLVTRKFIKAPDKDAYQLSVTKDGVTIEGDTYAGTFHGIQTLLQLMPTDQKSPASHLAVPFVTVSDYPRFGYRGMHLDVARHFFSVSFVKRYIDYLALHKLNYFHWHLTDDQGWRIEIKKYPELMSKAAYRNGTIVGRYPGTKNDNIRYGGYYTQEEAKEIVAYAAARHITVVPEIEMPGHASAAIAAYPWLSCFPEKETVIPAHPSDVSKGMIGIPPPGSPARPVKKVQETWGVFEDIFCAGKDSTFRFLEGVLEEVVPLFPSPYIHVGGDEAPKSHWKKCPSCQARMKAEGLKNEHELQSYFVQRMEKFLNAKGKTIIGWDEILEGGLAPNAIVMSWRGEKGGIEAARQKHQVIITPERPMYFDHTQTKNEDSVTIGGYNPIEAVYAYDPIPKELTEEQAKYILGAQANLWAEYIKNPSKVEYHIFPRLSALSEVLWSPKEKKNWNDFEQRLQTQFKRYGLWKANYSKAYFDLKTSIVPNKTSDGIKWVVESRLKCSDCQVQVESNFIRKDKKIRYDTLPISNPGNHDINKQMKFKVVKTEVLAGQPDYDYNSGDAKVEIAINSNATVKAYQIINTQKSSYVEQKFHFNKATGRKVSTSKTPNPRYPGQGGAFSLVNGTWSNKGLSHPDWLGWIGDDIEASIDLGKATSIDSVRMHTLDQKPSGVYLPQYVEVFASTDGKKFTSIGKSSTYVKDTLTMGWIIIPTTKTNARYLKVYAKNFGIVPDNQPFAGTKAWLFADEIQVY